MYTLDNLNINKIAKIENIYCENNIKRRMMDLGIVKGTKIKAILKRQIYTPRLSRSSKKSKLDFAYILSMR